MSAKLDGDIDIKPLDAELPSIAAGIHAVQMRAYAQEAALLGARDFPPLRRRIEDVAGDAQCYFGACAGHEVVGALGCVWLAGECLDANSTLDIVSLVVAPDWQRRGIAR